MAATTTGTPKTAEPKTKGFFDNLFGSMNKVINRNTYKIEDRKNTENLTLLNEELGLLSNIFSQKYTLLKTALYGPYGHVIYGGMVGGADKFEDYSYVASDNPKKRIFSTARFIANILKKYEKDLENILDKDTVKKLESSLININKTELELFSTIFKMDEIKTQLDMGNVSDKDVTDLEQLIVQARKNNEEAHNKRKDLLNKTQLYITGMQPVIPVMPVMSRPRPFLQNVFSMFF